MMPARARLGLGARSKTESMARISKRSLEAGRVHLQLLEAEGIDVTRPTTRADCAGGQRPCPWVSCKYNLYLDVTDAEGIKLNFPDLEADEVPPEKSCALDVAEQGGATLDDIATTMNVTRERVRQVEMKGIVALRARAARRGTSAKVLREYCDAPNDAAPVPTETPGSVFTAKPERIEPVEDTEDEEPPTRISFFADPDDERIDELVCVSVWNIFAKTSTARGFDCRSKSSIAASKVLAKKRAALSVGSWRETARDLRVEGLSIREIASRVGKSAASVHAAFRSQAHIEEETMDEPKKRGEMLRLVAEAQAAFKAKHGHAPEPKELFASMGPKIAKSVENVRMAMKRIAAKELNGATPSKPTARKSTPPPANRRKPVAKVEAKPPRASSTDPLVADLIAKRDDFRRKADALDGAIEAMSVAL